MIPLFISAFGLGLIFNVAPGAVFAESLRRGLIGGYSSALRVQFGSLIGDATWAVLGLVGAGLLFQIPAVRTPLTVVGAAYLAYLGLQSFRASAPSVHIASSSQGKALSDKGAVVCGASLSLMNPANVFYWAALGGVLGGLGVDVPTSQHYVIFFLGFMASSVLWCFVCAGMIHGLHRAMSPSAAKYLNWLCGVALLVLSAQSLGDLWGRALR